MLLMFSFSVSVAVMFGMLSYRWRSQRNLCEVKRQVPEFTAEQQHFIKIHTTGLLF